MTSAASTLLDLFSTSDESLRTIIAQFGALTYGLLFLVIFAETGFVVTPFLPGNSLIFAAGHLPRGACSTRSRCSSCSIAAVLGDDQLLDRTLHWARAYTGEMKWLKKEYLDRTHGFFQKHGGKTIFLARFVPIVRTFAPFVAGVGAMDYKYFLSYNIAGGIVWVSLFFWRILLWTTIPIVQQNFEFVMVAILC